MNKFISILLGLTFVLTFASGCATKDKVKSENPDISTVTENENTVDNSEQPSVDFLKTDADMFTDRDNNTSYDTASAVSINLNGNTAAASDDSVKISGSKITITKQATYVISGELTDGMIIVDTDDTAKLQLVFNGVNITSKSSAALYIVKADKVFLTLAEGTANTLSSGDSFTAIDDSNIDSTVFSKQDLTINGTGELTVTSPAGHGIVCKDDLVITGGTHTINSASHGIDANDSVRIANATLNIDAGKDAIHAENNDDSSKGFVYISSGNIKAEAEGDGISAGYYMQIADGTFDLLVGGGSENGEKEHSDSFGGFMGGKGPGGMRPGEMQNSTETTDESSTSMKGLKAENSISISGGNFIINSADDSIHSNLSVIISGGDFNIASGDDAIHAEETLTVTSGNIDISESYEGLEALHIDVQGGDVKLKASDDGFNAAGGVDGSGTQGGRDGMFGGERPNDMGGMAGGGRPGDMGGHGGMSANSNGSIKISGGNIYINSSGDGIDANGTLEISGGHTTVTGPTQGDTATLDYDKTAVITGGTFIGTGSTMMAQSFSDSDQAVVGVNAGNQASGTQIILKDENGNTIISHKPELEFAVVILSTPELVKNQNYTLTIGNQTNEVTAK